ncbi:hypothetical protein DTO006G1_2932 [Penicillium roqueforti]|uniref:uncharacterized protein n=1 Tax=Penicillium roqueforti TaxID=5082 RepID=UPI001909B28A|nr:uncharacterized protein LCP9604111_2181 [Penicillium roqueforti]KAF9252185.1 hypothetical protein LCP9604111_2181 [Penicillium roqueforti]KAI1837454.1 hypothetical protein CBS147337_1737 [Penicillium roqueforti]KAI2687892.1 hypothetical protein LCP963914a_3410 [Penicillium roqueforti]KAI2689728.1 hypothetical protein CBS147355_179 [Penicillium roqueforti]KAI2702277.1 hypothetical protein CBS147372_4010 [Penicillium roqueforti]
MLHVSCDVSASTTTTGANVCHLIDWDEDQGDSSKNRPSDNPDPKPTSTTSKITSTSPATTIATGKPVPSGLSSSRDDIQLVIFDSNRITSDGSTWHWAGYLLPSLGYDDEDVCNEKYEVISDPHVEDNQAWPFSMGPFNAPGLDYCFFHKFADPPSPPK